MIDPYVSTDQTMGKTGVGFGPATYVEQQTLSVSVDGFSQRSFTNVVNQPVFQVNEENLGKTCFRETPQAYAFALSRTFSDPARSSRRWKHPASARTKYRSLNIVIGSRHEVSRRKTS